LLLLCLKTGGHDCYDMVEDDASKAAFLALALEVDLG
jgi:hypothetical protein